MTGLEVNETVNENYARFRNQTKTRSKPEQFHQAIKELRKKVEEMGRLFEYVERMKSELNESGEGMKYKKHTENALKQIRESVTQLFITSRKLK
jgi:exonuclease VII small subunit